MSPLSPQALELQQPQCVWDSILEALLIVLLVFAAFAFGGNYPPCQEIEIGLAALMAVLVAVKLTVQREVRFRWTWAYLPIFLFVALVAFQLVPLPAQTVAKLSPNTLATKTQLLGDMPDSSAILRRVTLSFYPFVTRRDLRMVLALAAVFVVVVNVYRRPQQIKRLMIAISLIGVGIAALAAYMSLTGAKMIYGMTPVIHVNSGPFVNHSHFGQFMNLCIGAMLGLLLMRVGELTRGTTSLSDSYLRLRQGGFDFVWLFSGAIAFCAFMILLSLTRGGVLSLMIAGVVTAVLYAWRGARSSQVVFILLVAAVTMIALCVAFGAIYERMTTLRHISGDTFSRRQIIQDLHKAWVQFPITGMGLGTHRFVFPMFDGSSTSAQAMHAENEYAELMEETGGAGMILCLLFILIILAQYVKCIWNPRRSVQLGAYGLGMGLLAILIHSLSDFGQHLPINALLTCVSCGLLVSMARLGRSSMAPIASQAAPATRSWLLVPARAAVALAVIAVFLVPMRQARAATRAFFAFGDAQDLRNHFEANGWASATINDYIRMIRSADASAKIEPDDAMVRFLLTDFRWRAISRDRDQQGVVNARTRVIRHLADDLDAIRPLCPTFGWPCAQEGWLRFFMLGEQSRGEALVRTGYSLDKSYPYSCYALSEVAGARGDWSTSFRAAKRAADLAPGSRQMCVLFFVDKGRTDLAYDLVRGDADGLSALADLLGPDGSSQELVKRCRAEASELMSAEADRDDATPELMARVAEMDAKNGKDNKAIELYERALARRYAQADWRLRLAQLLLKTGDQEGAVREARICLRLRPDLEEAKAIADLPLGTRPAPQ